MYYNYAAVTPAHAPGERWTPHAGLGVVTSVGGFGQDELLHDMVYPPNEAWEHYFPGEFVGPPAPGDTPLDTGYTIKTPTVWAEAPSIPWWVWALLGVVTYKALK